MKRTSGKFFLSFTCAVLGFACAKPNYQDPTAPAQGNVPTSSSEKPHEEGYTYHLQFGKSALTLDMKWETVPTEKATGTLILKFSDQTEDIEPRVFLWMPSMGHGSSPVKTQRISPHFYRAEKVFFVMPGEWEIHVQIKNQFGEVDEAIQKISI